MSAVPNGLFLTHDSAYYYSAAQSLLADGTLTGASGEPFTNWPPLYPFLLFLMHANLFAIKQFHCIVYIGTLLVPTLILSRVKINRSMFAVFVLSQTFSVTLISHQIFLLSEGVFILLSMILFWLLMSYQKSERGNLFIWLIICSNALCLQRMMGVYIVICISMCLFLKKEYKKGFIYGLLSIIGLLIWVFIKQYNQQRDSFLDNVAVSDRLQLLTLTLKEMSNLFIPNTSFIDLEILFGLFLCVISVWFFIRSYKSYSTDLIKQLFVWVYGYLFLVIIAAGSSEELSRFVLPVFPFLIMQLLIGADQYLFEKKELFISLSAVIVIGLWLLYTVLRMCKNTVMWHNS